MVVGEQCDSKIHHWISLADAAEHAGVCVETVRRAARDGRLRCVKVNGARVWRTTRQWVDLWLVQATKEDDGGKRSA